MSTADVLAINAPGYLPMPADDDNALFQGVAQCYLRGSFNCRPVVALTRAKIFPYTTNAAAC